jgi:hypothetical protein
MTLTCHLGPGRFFASIGNRLRPWQLLSFSSTLRLPPTHRRGHSGGGLGGGLRSASIRNQKFSDQPPFVGRKF